MALQHLKKKQCIAVDDITSSFVFGDTAANWSSFRRRGEGAAMKDIDPLFLMINKRSVNGGQGGETE